MILINLTVVFRLALRMRFLNKYTARLDEIYRAGSSDSRHHKYAEQLYYTYLGIQIVILSRGSISEPQSHHPRYRHTEAPYHYGYHTYADSVAPQSDEAGAITVVDIAGYKGYVGLEHQKKHKSKRERTQRVSPVMSLAAAQISVLSRSLESNPRNEIGNIYRYCDNRRYLMSQVKSALHTVNYRPTTPRCQ